MQERGGMSIAGVLEDVLQPFLALRMRIYRHCIRAIFNASSTLLLGL